MASFFHFLDMTTAKRVRNCEVSIIDTAIALNGVICAGEYFGGEVKEKAEEVYGRVNWQWYLNKETKQFTWDIHLKGAFRCLEYVCRAIHDVLSRGSITNLSSRP